MIKKGLKVRVLTGKDKKKEGEVIEIDRSNNRAKVKGINMVKKHLIERQNPWLGLDAMLVNGALSRALNIPASGGILVENVADFSPADEMGLHGGNIPVNILGEEIILGGDIIIAIDSLPCATPEDLVNITKLMDSKKNGDVIKVKVIRGAVVKTLNWAIRKQPLPEIGK